MWKHLFGSKDKPKPAPPPACTLKVALDTDLCAIPEGDTSFIFPTETTILRALEAWSWLSLGDMTVFAVSAFGEPFMEAVNGAIHHLDTTEGKLHLIADSRQTFRDALCDEEMRDTLLLTALVTAAREHGLALQADECYHFKIAPVLGGAFHIDNIEVTPLLVSIELSGLLHDQIRNLPDDAEFGGFRVVD